MARNSEAHRTLPNELADLLLILGRDLEHARKRRKISRDDMAARMMVNSKTVSRLERGDPTVGLGILATALWVLGLHGRLGDLASPQSDKTALQEDLKRLPQRISRLQTQADDLDF